MVISCTKKLQDELGIKAPLVPVADRLYGWHGNFLRINRRKTLVLVHDESRYTVILHGLKAKDFQNLNKLIPQAIRAVLEADGVQSSIVSRYLEEAGDIVFSKTQGAKLVARLNKGCEATEIWGDHLDATQLFQPKVSKRINRNIYTKEAGNQFLIADEVFYQSLEQRYGCSPFRWPAVTLDVKMDFETLLVSRKIVVPLAFTFGDLHKILQIAFSWQDYHLHQFTVMDGAKPLVTISDGDDECWEEEPPLLEQDVKLSEYLPKYKHLVYTYDYGDNWEHLVSVGDVIFDYDKNYATCLKGQGDAPPEDVGGEGGYMEFLEILQDKSHPERKSTVLWINSKWDYAFDMDRINCSLKYSHTFL